MFIQSQGSKNKKRYVANNIFSKIVILVCGISFAANLPASEKQLATKRLNYVVGRTTEPSANIFTLTPEASDFVDNQLVLNALVGGLVRYSHGGNIESYLAEKWSSSADGLNWDFNLRENLKCEDGEVINAESYVANLKKSLLIYARRGEVLTFKHLNGWQEFVTDPEFKNFGIIAKKGNIISFNFKNKIDNFLDTLVNPYFGYWCKANFKGDNFDPSPKFISSGAFETIANQNPLSVLLKKSKNWFEHNMHGYNEIEFIGKKLTEDLPFTKNTIVKLGMIVPEIKNMSDFNVVRTPPFYLTTFILSHKIGDGIFTSVKNRQIFQDRLESYNYPSFFAENSLYKANFFYESQPSLIKKRKKANLSKIKYNNQIINVDTPHRFGKKVEKLFEEMVYNLLPEVPKQNIHFNIVNFKLSEYAKKATSNTFYDIRIASVDAGSDFTNTGTGIEMMFCSTLGVGFPDPSTKICKQVESYAKTNKPVDKNYAKRFNQILYDDASVIPLFRSGLSWLYSKDINVKTIPTGNGYAIFERIEATENE